MVAMLAFGVGVLTMDSFGGDKAQYHMSPKPEPAQPSTPRAISTKRQSINCQQKTPLLPPSRGIDSKFNNQSTQAITSIQIQIDTQRRLAIIQMLLQKSP
jgi:hypothetical protein